jgi:DNA-binding MarR family transcriptional regulator
MLEASETRKRRGFVLKPLRKPTESNSAYIDATDGQGELLLSLLLRTSIRLQTALDRCFLPFGVTSQEAAVLVRCVEAGEISAGRLAQAMSRDKGKITRFIDRLEAGKFLSRASDPRDHRLLIIKPTSRGRRIAPRLKGAFEEIRKQFFAGISLDDIAQLVSVLSQLHVNAGQSSEGGPVRRRED